MKYLLIGIFLIQTVLAQIAIVPNEHNRHYCVSDTFLVTLIPPFPGGTWTAPVNVINNQFRPSECPIGVWNTFLYTYVKDSVTHVGGITIFVNSKPTIDILNNDTVLYAQEHIKLR